jgi:group I intron endonuclease
MTGTLNKLRGKAGIYVIVNTVTGRFYLGSTTDFYKRRSHYASAFRGSGWCNSGLKKDVQKYGASLFVFRVIEEVEYSEAKQPGFLSALEDAYLNSVSIDDVYNYTHRRMLKKKQNCMF